MKALRFQVVGEAFKKKPLDVKAPEDRPATYFGRKVFNREKMYKYLPKQVYEKMIDVMDNGARLDRDIADAVASGMKQWAVENGVTHYTHWFQLEKIKNLEEEKKKIKRKKIKRRKNL